jgi:hypothetical protein
VDALETYHRMVGNVFKYSGLAPRINLVALFAIL